MDASAPSGTLRRPAQGKHLRQSRATGIDPISTKLGLTPWIERSLAYRVSQEALLIALEESSNPGGKRVLNRIKLLFYTRYF